MFSLLLLEIIILLALSTSYYDEEFFIIIYYFLDTTTTTTIWVQMQVLRDISYALATQKINLEHDNFVRAGVGESLPDNAFGNLLFSDMSPFHYFG